MRVAQNGETPAYLRVNFVSVVNVGTASDPLLPRSGCPQVLAPGGNSSVPLAIRVGSRVRRRCMSTPLPHYLRTYRKNSGLSQVDVAFLLGSQSGARVSRYEHHHRQPTLETAVGYCVLFDARIAELFAGLYDDIADDICRRAGLLLSHLQQLPPDPPTRKKVASLRTLVGASEK